MGQKTRKWNTQPACSALVRGLAMSFLPTFQESRHLRRWLWRHRGEVVVGAACLATAAAVASALLLGADKADPVPETSARDAGPEADADGCREARCGSAPEAATAKAALASDSSSDSDPGAICEHTTRLPWVSPNLRRPVSSLPVPSQAGARCRRAPPRPHASGCGNRLVRPGPGAGARQAERAGPRDSSTGSTFSVRPPGRAGLAAMRLASLPLTALGCC